MKKLAKQMRDMVEFYIQHPKDKYWEPIQYTVLHKLDPKSKILVIGGAGEMVSTVAKLEGLMKLLFHFKSYEPKKFHSSFEKTKRAITKGFDYPVELKGEWVQEECQICFDPECKMPNVRVV